jgi:heme iron utilization protein
MSFARTIASLPVVARGYAGEKRGDFSDPTQRNSLCEPSLQIAPPIRRTINRLTVNPLEGWRSRDDTADCVSTRYGASSDSRHVERFRRNRGLNNRKTFKCHPFITMGANRSVIILTNEKQGLDRSFDAVAEAKHILRTTRAAAMATLAGSDHSPFASLANVATAADGSPLLLLSRLAAHTRHLEADPRLSLLFYSALNQPSGGDPLTHARLMIVGTAERVGNAEELALVRARFLARHPKSALYADFTDFSFFSVIIEAAYLNGGFGRAGNVAAESLLTSLAGAEELLREEAGLLSKIGESEPDLANELARAHGGSGTHWRIVGFDPEGLDLSNDEKMIRIAFSAPVTSEVLLRRQLADLRASAKTGRDSITSN